MKTFLGFMTGLLSGTMLGVFFIALLCVTNKRFRDYCDDVAEDLYN